VENGTVGPLALIRRWLAVAVLLDGAWLTGMWDRWDEYEPLPAAVLAPPRASARDLAVDGHRVYEAHT
jgi:hypothetical protein